MTNGFSKNLTSSMGISLGGLEVVTDFLFNNPEFYESDLAETKANITGHQVNKKHYIKPVRPKKTKEAIMNKFSLTKKSPTIQNDIIFESPILTDSDEEFDFDFMDDIENTQAQAIEQIEDDSDVLEANSLMQRIASMNNEEISLSEESYDNEDFEIKDEDSNDFEIEDDNNNEDFEIEDEDDINIEDEDSDISDNEFEIEDEEDFEIEEDNDDEEGFTIDDIDSLDIEDDTDENEDDTSENDIDSLEFEDDIEDESDDINDEEEGFTIDEIDSLEFEDDTNEDELDNKKEDSDALSDDELQAINNFENNFTPATDESTQDIVEKIEKTEELDTVNVNLEKTEELGTNNVNIEKTVDTNKNQNTESNNTENDELKQMKLKFAEMEKELQELKSNKSKEQASIIRGNVNKDKNEDIVNKLVGSQNNKEQKSNKDNTSEKYSTMSIESLYNEVKAYMNQMGVKKRVIDLSALNEKFGEINIRKLIQKSYLIKIGSKGVTVGR